MVTSSRAASLADEIEAAIVAGDIASGDRLGTKDDLRRRYDVAYGTLNEALRILQQRGYVTSRTGPGGGLFATIPTSSDRLRHLLSGFPEGGSLRDCAECGEPIPEPRRAALPGVRVCLDCASEQDKRRAPAGGINRRGSKDSQLK